MPDFRDILHNIKNKNFAPVYIFMGEELYYVDKLVNALEANVVNEEDKVFDQTILFGADTNASFVMEAAGMFPLMSEKRLVALREAQTMHQAKKQLDLLKPYILKPNPLTVLVIAYKGDKLNATSDILKAAKANKDVIVFDSPKIKEYKIGEIIKDYCFEEKVTIEEKAIEVLVANIGSSLDKIFSEIEKLRVSQKEGNLRITASMVHDQIGISKEYNNFELISALSRRDYFQVINIVKNFEVNPKQNPTVVTSSMIFNYYQRLVIAAFSQDKSDKGLMESLQLKTPYALKEIKIGLHHYNASQLVKAIHIIRKFDTRSKGVESFQKEYPLLLELVCELVTL